MWSREYVDVMEIIFTVLILSKGTTQQKLKLMYRCANFDDESEAMSKDDILLPLKAFVTSAFTIFNLVLVDDENIESMCEQLYYDVCCVDLTVKLTKGVSHADLLATLKKASEGELKVNSF